MRLLKLTLLLVLCACTHSVYAQRHYVGISALDFSKLSETSDLFIVETDQFGLIDGNGNSYDFDSRENF